MSYLPLIYLLVTVLLTSVAQLLQKQAAIDLESPAGHGSLLSNLNFVLSGVLLGTALITWLQVLNSMEVSIAYPMLSLNYILVLILAKFIFGEKVPSHRWVGVACIIAGVAVLASGNVIQ